MKKRFVGVLWVCSLAAGLFAGEAAKEAVEAAATPESVQATSLTEAEIEELMKAIFVEEMQINKIAFAKAMEQVDGILKQYGLQLLFRPADAASAERLVSLKTRGLSMASNLSFLCRQVGYDWWSENGVIIVGFPARERRVFER